MPRASDIPKCPENWQSPKPEAGRSYEIELITPLFGGGVETQVNDPSFPIRVTSIRGQLQFWWRATVGAQYETRQDLRAAQSAIWGNTKQASRVIVRVEEVHADKPVQCAHYEYKPPRGDGDKRARHDLVWNEPFSIPEKRHWGTEYVPKSVTYALFPFQGEKAKRIEPDCKPEVEPAHYIPSAKFRLRVICPNELWPQVEPALWAWVNFGGLGSRTRRGCGAIFCKALAPKEHKDLIAKLKTFFQAPTDLREWPTLAAAFLVGREQNQSLDAWNEVIKHFQHFRQGTGLGRNLGEQRNRPGRSRWPEPETIRRVTERRLRKHSRLTHIPDDAFPRAELGLPIVFHFQEQGDPPDTFLYPDNDSKGKKRERMASPLILKPLALMNGKFVPLIVRLNTLALNGVDLRRGEQSLQLPQTTVIRDPKLATYRDSPMQNRSPNGSAIEAFIAYAKSQGFTEVTR